MEQKLLILADHRQSPAEIKGNEQALINLSKNDVNSYLKSLIEVFKSSTEWILSGRGEGLDRGRQEQLQLSSLLLIKTLISTRWKPRGGCVRKKVVQVGADDIASQEIPPELTPATKNCLRATLISFLACPPPLPFTTAVKNSINAIVAKVGRSDLASDFPALLPTLLQSLHGNIFTTNCLNKLLKELSTKRILLHKKNFAIISSTSFPIVMELFADYCNKLHPALTATLNQTEPTALLNVNQNLLQHFKIITKIASKLLVNTLPSLLSSAETNGLVGYFFNCSLTLLELLYTALPLVPESHPVHTPLVKILNRLSSTAVGAQENSPLKFASFLAPHLTFFHKTLRSSVASKQPGQPFAFDKLVISGCNFLTNVRMCSVYDASNSTKDQVSQYITKSSITAKGDSRLDEELLKTAINTTGQFFSSMACQELAKIAVTGLMLLTVNDLRQWDEDPEEYMTADNQATVSDSVKSAGQQLFLGLLESKGGVEMLGGFLANLLSDFEGQLEAARIESAGVDCQSERNQLLDYVSDPRVLYWDAIFTAAGVASYVLDDKVVNFTHWFERSLAPSLTVVMQSSPRKYGVPILRHRLVWLLGCWVQDLTDALRPQIYGALVHVVNDGGEASDTMVKLTCVQTLNAVFEDWNFMTEAFKPLAATFVGGMYSLLARIEELEMMILVLQTCSVLVARMGGELGVEAANAVVVPLLGIWEGCGEENSILRQHVLNILTSIVGVVGTEGVVQLYPIVLPMLDFSVGGGGENVYLTEHALTLWLGMMRLSPSYNEGFHVLFPKIAGLVVSMDWEHLKASFLLLETYIVQGGEVLLRDHGIAVGGMFSATVGNVKTKAATYVMMGLDGLMRKFPVEGARLLTEAGVLAAVVSCCRDAVEDKNEREPDITLVQWMSVLARCLLVDRGTGERVILGGGMSVEGMVGLFFNKFDSTGEETLECGKGEHEVRMVKEIERDPVMGDLKGYIKAKLDGVGGIIGEERWREVLEGCEPVVLGQLKGLLG